MCVEIHGGRWHFNPRSPHGERRLTKTICLPNIGFQSTLPARGATELFRNAIGACVFQSTLPARGATRVFPFLDMGAKFQSTLPARGATKASIMIQLIIGISIHAPRTGSDVCLLDFIGHICQFQSTLPARGATSIKFRLSALRKISIHAPRTGSDYGEGSKRRRFRISIHAPRTGSDRFRRCAIDAMWNFNPRSPHGERLAISVYRFVCVEISIHAPRTGSDAANTSCDTSRYYFNPRSPHGERPLEKIGTKPAESFQSTLPARGATGKELMDRVTSGISIHAPRTGSDDLFNSAEWLSDYFNPRSPHGERRFTGF